MIGVPRPDRTAARVARHGRVDGRPRRVSTPTQNAGFPIVAGDEARCPSYTDSVREMSVSDMGEILEHELASAVEVRDRDSLN